MGGEICKLKNNLIFSKEIRLWQIITGFSSPKAMFQDFSISEDNQMKGFCTFIVKYSNGSLLKACQ